MFYPADRISLPSGRHTVKLFYVEDGDNWSEIAQFRLNENGVLLSRTAWRLLMKK